MKSLISKILAAFLLTAALAGCGSIKPQSAMEWMESQPWTSDTAF